MPFDEMEQRRGSIERNRENAARMAFAVHRFEVTGAGSIEFPNSAQFGLAFLDQPYMSFGCAIDLDDLADAMNVGDDTTPPLPIVTGYVSDWDQNDQDFYVGAWCAVNIYWTVAPPTDFSFTVDFVFRGIGIKDVDPEVRT